MPRYPVPSERPEFFRLNMESPLAQGLVFGNFGQHPGSTFYKDESPYGNHGTLVGYTGARNLPQDRWGWSNYLKRPILSFSGASSDYVSSSTACKPLQGISYATVAAWMSKSAGAQIGAGAGTGRFLILWFTDGNAYFTAKGSPLSAAGASGTRHFCMSIAGNSLVGHIDGVQKVTSTNAGTTTLAATLGPQICGYDSTNGYSTGSVADLCFWTRVLSDSEKWQIADPSNVDLRIGNIPMLISYRKFFAYPFTDLLFNSGVSSSLISGTPLNDLAILSNSGVSSSLVSGVPTNDLQLLSNSGVFSSLVSGTPINNSQLLLNSGISSLLVSGTPLKNIFINTNSGISSTLIYGLPTNEYSSQYTTGIQSNLLTPSPTNIYTFTSESGVSNTLSLGPPIASTSFNENSGISSTLLLSPSNQSIQTYLNSGLTSTTIIGVPRLKDIAYHETTFVPSDIDGCIAWLDDQLFYQDNPPTTTCTTVGEEVVFWYDLSGNENHAKLK